ncbi:hypothetical protein BFJ69_g5949 [Fusarium oxysporum]|uniref:Uncharacterized protein n=1 Tax=Fusarium oxysporum TaxID=5507 RepID=A0A420NCF9_FUSOX|nr:hypothetical protein BFJ69_g5949 [Fusarium oxysporum]
MRYQKHHDLSRTQDAHLGPTKMARDIASRSPTPRAVQIKPANGQRKRRTPSS